MSSKKKSNDPVFEETQRTCSYETLTIGIVAQTPSPKRQRKKYIEAQAEASHAHPPSPKHLASSDSTMLVPETNIQTYPHGMPNSTKKVSKTPLATSDSIKHTFEVELPEQDGNMIWQRKLATLKGAVLCAVIVLSGVALLYTVFAPHSSNEKKSTALLFIRLYYASYMRMFSRDNACATFSRAYAS